MNTHFAPSPKTFDCVQMKNDIQAEIYAEIKDMSSDKRIAYFNEGLENDSFWQSLKSNNKS